MRRQRALVWLRVAFVIVVTPLSFVLVQQRARNAELRADVATLWMIGNRRVPALSGTSALIAPLHSGAFWIYMSPSCSSIASLLTLACLAAVLPRRLVRPRSRLVACVAAWAAVFVGNLIRIDASIEMGVLFGRSSLVLFHDWAGSIFGFAYTMGGFVLMLWILLPGRRARQDAGTPADPGTDPAALPAGSTSGSVATA